VEILRKILACGYVVKAHEHSLQCESSNSKGTGICQASRPFLRHRSDNSAALDALLSLLATQSIGDFRIASLPMKPCE
ncbi:hypothetical protein, partial [Caballeronia sp.]|uniref:hypothetical protein n=1 Tax=Caballeronia sp. TaxID=1931223 RepID=UPI003C4B545E